MQSILRRLHGVRRVHLLSRRAIDDALWQRVVGELDVLTGLTSDELKRLRELVTLFVYRKRFYGTYEMEIDDYVRVAIAAQACLLILNLAERWDTHVYAGWVSIILYPGAFVARHEYRDEIGVVHEQISALEGEASAHGPVVISWEDARPGAIPPREGRNVVLHEFAHKLDFLDGSSNGHPPLPRNMSQEAWIAAFSSAYDHLKHLLENHRPTPFNPYAAKNPAEFFAVMTEEFFQIPHRLMQVYPGVYEQLALFYRQDPVARRPPVRHVRKHYRTLS
jgi:Mlc titration factor MtfA (ptsG expression regulator)